MLVPNVVPAATNVAVVVVESKVAAVAAKLPVAVGAISTLRILMVELFYGGRSSIKNCVGGNSGKAINGGGSICGRLYICRAVRPIGLSLGASDAFSLLVRARVPSCYCVFCL